MASRNTRWVGAAMTSASLVALLLTYAIAVPQTAHALSCCQTCEAQEAACAASCASSSHTGGDTLQACDESCYYWLYEWTYGCWRHCEYCQQEPGSECWSCLVTDHGSSPGYAHVEYCWETGSGFCS